MKKRIAIVGFLFVCLFLSACGGTEQSTTAGETSWADLDFSQETEILYATQFDAASTQDGYTKLTVADGETYLLVPEGKEVPGDVPAEVTVIRQPLENIYLAATSAMDLFRGLDAIDKVTLSGLEADGWYIQEAKDAMAAGQMVYAGKYRAPDYELILSKHCDLAIESTMIYHNPEVKEQLEGFDIPVFVERSSYESHPLGRMEWIKVYGLLLGCPDEATAYFDQMMKDLEPVFQTEPTGKTVAYFYLTANGAANVRKSGDYLAKAIELAGGTYAFQDLAGEDNAQATTNLQMEAFYTQAKDADIFIYSGSIDGGLESLDQLLEKSPLLADCKAVREGKVWCTGKNFFQESLGLGDFMADVNKILTQDQVSAEDLTYLYPLT